jgi:hypothetical protein
MDGFNKGKHFIRFASCQQHNNIKEISPGSLYYNSSPKMGTNYKTPFNTLNIPYILYFPKKPDWHLPYPLEWYSIQMSIQLEI